MEDMVMPFGDWLRDELSRLELSQRRFATRIGVQGVTVSKWVRGETYPTRDKVPAIAQTLGRTEQQVWDALREPPATPHNDTTLARLLDLPDDVRHYEIVLLRNMFRAIRQTEREIAEDVPRGARLG